MKYRIINLHCTTNCSEQFLLRSEQRRQQPRGIRREARLLGKMKPGAAEIARRSRGTPRLANRLLKRVRDYAQVCHKGEITEDLDTKVTTETPLTFPNGCHIAEVEVDPQTGRSTLAAYSAVDDCGNVLDHMVIEGQVHGSVAMGFGQAMMEGTVFDPSNGQLVTASFMDYAMPRAEDLPMFKDGVYPVPATTNPLGVKGAGEAGTVGSLSAGVNAIVDALSVYGIHHIDTPCTPFRVWQAIQAARP